MNNFNSPFGNQAPKDILKRFYSLNKILVYILLGSLLTLILLHGTFFNIFYTVYLIYFGGVIFKQYFKDDKLIKTFILSGFFGSILSYLIFKENFHVQQLIIAFIGSGAISLITSAATFSPNASIQLALFGNVKLKWVALILIGLDILTINPSSPDARLTDIGGVIYGFLNIYLFNRSADSFKFKMPSFFGRPKPYYKKPSSKKPFTRSQTIEKDEDFNARKKSEQESIDKILDKIKKSGYDTLSAEEKRKLFDQSRN